MAKTAYSAAQARRIVGVTQRCLDYWDERGIVSPSIRQASGKGSERRYGFDDLLKLTLVKKFRKAGLSLQRIQKGLKALRERWPDNDPLLDELLATDGVTFFRIKGEQMEDVLNGGQLVMSFVAVGRIRQELEQHVIRLNKCDAVCRGRPKRSKAARGQ